MFRVLVKFLNARQRDLRQGYLEAITAMTRAAGGSIKLSDPLAGVLKMPVIEVNGLPSGYRFHGHEFIFAGEGAIETLVLRGIIVSDDAEQEVFDMGIERLPLPTLLNVAEMAVESLEKPRLAA